MSCMLAMIDKLSRKHGLERIVKSRAECQYCSLKNFPKIKFRLALADGDCQTWGAI